MSNRARIGLVVSALAVAVAAFFVLRPEDSGDKADDPGTQVTQTTTGAEASSAPAATAPSAPRPPPEEIAMEDGKPQGGVTRIERKRGQKLRLVVTSDAADEIHVHGYDIKRKVAPGKPARFRLTMDVEGVFEIESHVAEDAGRDPLIGRLVVSPG